MKKGQRGIFTMSKNINNLIEDLSRTNDSDSHFLNSARDEDLLKLLEIITRRLCRSNESSRFKEVFRNAISYLSPYYIKQLNKIIKRIKIQNATYPDFWLKLFIELDKEIKESDKRIKY